MGIRARIREVGSSWWSVLVTAVPTLLSALFWAGAAVTYAATVFEVREPWFAILMGSIAMGVLAIALPLGLLGFSWLASRLPRPKPVPGDQVIALVASVKTSIASGRRLRMTFEQTTGALRDYDMWLVDAWDHFHDWPELASGLGTQGALVTDASARMMTVSGNEALMAMERLDSDLAVLEGAVGQLRDLFYFGT